MSIKNNIQELDELYLRYGYEIKKSISNDFARVYILNKGVYFGTDIVEIINNEDEINKISNQLSKLGYACREKKYLTIKDAEDNLFNAFFHSDSLKERLRNKFSNFALSQTKLLRVNYQYIPVSYFVDDQTQLSKNNIIENIIKKLDKKGPCLIIIEAAAGFGKTCTAFEIINYISKYRNDKSPIFTELSKDRKVSKFKYILQDVILNEFHSLLSENVVIHEVQKGRIPLIIDGFDELLSKEQDKAGKDDFEQVETMLYTIGVLLQNEAKVILTGRKTAIFSGDSFKQWVDESPNEFSVSRFLINPPNIEDWLDSEKIEIIKKYNIPIKDISNPVLLAFLRSLSLDSFIAVVENPELIVEKYFNAILDREQERQELRLGTSIQLQIFKSLAEEMMKYDITSDTKEWIKLLIEDKNRLILENARKSYPLASRPTIEELTNILSNHALLDRKGSDDKIGFINDFIFGTFITDSILDLDVNDLDEISNHMYELGVTSSQFQKQSKKYLLWEKIKEIKKFTSQEKLNFEYLLKNTVEKSFDLSSFNDLSLCNITFNNQQQFNQCVFSNCCFKKTNFYSSAFFETSFINCNFIECEIHNDIENESITTRILLFGGIDYDNGFIETYEGFINNIETFNEDNIENEILNKFFYKGTHRAKMKKLSYLISEFIASNRVRVSIELDKLKKLNYIKSNGDNTFLTEDGLKYAISKI